MAIKITVRQGGGAGGSTLDVTDQTQVLWDKEFAAGHMCGNGAACQYTLFVDDDPNDMPEYGVKAFAARNVVTISEDAPGSDIWLARGRVANTETALGDLINGTAVQHKITVEDGNVDLRGIVLQADWVRSTETGAARAQALIEEFCQSDPRLTTDIDTHLIDAPSSNSLDDHTYPAGTTVTEVMDDIVQQDGKMYGVVIHHDGGSHLCLLYTGETNHSTYVCTLEITDDNPNLTTSFPPIWDQGAAVHRDGQGVISGVYSKYGMESAVTASDASLVDTFDYWWITHNDGTAQTQARAQLRANNLLTYRGQEHITHQVTIKLPADMVDLVCAGMSIDLTSAASAGGENLGTTITRRITQLKWEPIAPEVGAVVGHYYAHMELDRPMRVLPERGGVSPRPPSSGSSSGVVDTVHAYQDSGGPSVTGLDVLTSDSTLYAVWLAHDGVTSPTANYRPNPASSSGQQAMALVHTEAHSTASSGTNTDNETIFVFRLTNPTVASGSGIVFSGSGTLNGWAVGAWLVSGTAAATYFSNEGTGTSSTVTPTAGTNDLVLDAVGWRIWSLGDASNEPSQTASQIADWGVGFNNAPGQPDMAWGGAHKTGSGARTWSWTTSTNWVAVAIVIAGAGADTTEPVDGTGTGSPGTNDDVYSPIDHKHEHANITTGGPYHMAEDLTIADAGGYWDATTVEALGQEVGEAVRGYTNHGNTGATETFDFGVGHHRATVNADLTVSFSGAVSGDSYWTVVEYVGDGTPRTLGYSGSTVTGTVTLDSTLNAITTVIYRTVDGGTNVLAVQSGAAATDLDDLTDVTITSPSNTQAIRYNGTAWVNTSQIWRPLMDGAGNAITDSGTGEAIMALS